MAYSWRRSLAACSAYLISLINNVLNFMDVSTHYQLIAQGLIVIAAVSIYVDKRKRI